MNFGQLEEEFNRLQQRKAELAVQRGELVKPVSELRAKLDAVMKERMTGLTETQVDGLLNKMRTFNVDIKQIHVKSVDSGGSLRVVPSGNSRTTHADQSGHGRPGSFYQPPHQSAVADS